jgi:hypothetical protein
MGLDPKHPCPAHHWFELENLYYRISADEVRDNKVLPEALRLPHTSFNRGGFSWPNEVAEELLGARPDQNGIAQLPVHLIPKAQFKAQGDNALPYRLHAAHDPILYNYAHAELWTCKDSHEKPSRPENPPGSSKLKKEIREAIIDVMTIQRNPTPPPEEEAR